MVDPRPCLSVVMPCYNERATIAALVDRGAGVALDGRDHRRRRRLDRRHPRRARRARRATGARASLHDRNRGKGAALRTGFAAATADVVIVQDADLEYDPPSIRDAGRPCSSGQADVVFGSRFLGGRPHRVLYFWHSLGNRLLTLLSNMFTNLNLTDMETCYKVFRREVLAVDHARGGPLRLRARDHRQGRRAAGGASTRSASPTPAAPTPRARRSAGATACAPSCCIVKYSPVGARVASAGVRWSNSCRSPIPHRVTSSIDSTTMRPDIFDVPHRRSVNVIGDSVTVQPRRTSRRTSSVKKA